MIFELRFTFKPLLKFFKFGLTSFKYEIVRVIKNVLLGKCASLKSLDVDASDNLTEEMLQKFIEK